MGLKVSEKERLFKECRDSIQEVTGWKMFIFLPQSTTWKFFLVCTIILKCVYNFTRAFYVKPPFLFSYADSCCDFFYCADAVLSLLHYSMRKTRKLRFGKKRHPALLVLDFVSIMPLETLYKLTVYDEEGKHLRLAYALNLIGVLRIYQLPVNFCSIKNSICKAKTYVIVTVFQVLTYSVILTHFLSCLIVFCFDKKEKKYCLDNFLACTVENFMITYYFLGQSYSPPFLHFDIKKCKPLLLADFIIGYAFTYGFVTPMFLFVSIKFLGKYFEYARKLRHVKVLTGNFIQDKKAKKRVLDYFYELWSFGRCDRYPELLDSFPLGFRKSIFCDMHWDAMRHSFLLRDVSLGCKRSLALHMKTEFLLPETRIFERHLEPGYFLYLESGLIHIMAEENNEVPVLSLSGGTVWGEMSLFLYRNSLATAYTGKFSIIHTLSPKDFFKVLQDYPKDKKRVFVKVKTRLKLARSMYEIKRNITINLAFTKSKTMDSIRWGNIKWIKSQYRAICQLEEAEKLLALHQYTADDYERQLLKLNTQLKHSSVFLSYLCVNEEKGNQFGIVCLKKFPWLMDPQCQFLAIWKWMIYMTAVVTVLIYPAYMSWHSSIPMWFFNFSCLISLMNIIDIVLQFSTAIKFKNFIVQKFSVVVVERVTRLFFIADLIAAVPVQFFLYSENDNNYATNAYFVNAMAKIYLLIPLLYRLNYCPRPKAFFRTMVKFIIMLLILIYFSACLLFLSAIECVFYACEPDEWINSANGSISDIEIAILRAVHLGFEIPQEETFNEDFGSYLVAWLFFVIYKHFYYALNGECVGTYVLELSYDVEYKSRMTFVHDFMGRQNMVGLVRVRALTTMKFQWNYDRNNYITEKDRIWEDLSATLTEEIKRKCVLPYLVKSKLFESEDETFLMSLAKRVTRLALPAKSVLLTLGTQSSRLYIIQKGFVQINSFISGDLNLNRSRRITAKVGDTFPVVDLLCQAPSAISAVTVSDCELLVLDLEDIISELMIHGMFKDFVSSIQETNMTILTTAKLGISEYKDVFSEGGEPYTNVFKPFRVLLRILRFCLRSKPINSHSVFYLYWEVSRVVATLINVIVWPIALAWFNTPGNKAIFLKILFCLDLLAIFDFYIRLHVAYYNRLGIYVSHTLCTATHYLSTAFIADFIAFSPNFHVLALIINESFGEQHWEIYLTHIILRSFSLYRPVGFMKYLKDIGYFLYRAEYIITFFFAGLIVHYYICLIVHLIEGHGLSPQFRLTANDSLVLDTPIKCYLNELGLVLAFALKAARFLNHHDTFTILYAGVASTLGLISRMWLTAHLILNCTTSTRTLTTYQYYMQSFIHFLIRQKADMKIVSQAVEYFEYEWERKKGYRLHNIFECLPETLHEDIMFPLYKRALSGVPSLMGVNEYFYRTLSRYAVEMVCKEGFMIIFPNEVQQNIYFIHSGQCVVQNTRQILYVGSVFGDINRKGIMKNTITSRTPIKLLKISSRQFFLTLENFDKTKMAFSSEAAINEDFIPSIYIEEIQSFTVEREEEECEFIVAAEARTRTFKRKRKRFYLKSDSKLYLLLRFVFMLNAYCTVIVIPMFMAVRNYGPTFLTIIYLLDFIWLIKLIVQSRIIDTQVKQPKTRRFKNPVAVIRMLYNVISIIPFEVVPLIHCRESFTSYCCFITCMCYVNRLCRLTYVFEYFKKKGKGLLLNFYMNVLGIVLLKIGLLNISCAIRLSLHHLEVFELKKCYTTLSGYQKDQIVFSYLCVFNDFIGAGMDACLPYVASQVFFQMFVSIWSFASRGLLISQIMMIIYVTDYNKSILMVQLEQLQHYLTVRDVSPSLRTGTQTYFTNLLNSFSEAADPLFLTSAPPALKTTITANIYMSFLQNCYLFRGLEDFFLKQLSARLALNIFFPGDYIVQKGDVDHNIYFIQTGEVYCIQTDKQFTALEKAIEVYYSGASFGAEQGILAACPHKFTYRAKILTHMLVLNYFKWEDLRVAFPNIFETIYKTLIHSQP